MMEEDALIGVTSNPTIFQKAMAEGEWYDDQLREVLKRGGRPEGDLPPARDGRHRGRVRPASARSGTGATARTATSRWRSTRTSPTTPTRRSRRRQRFHDWVERPNLYVKIPATKPGLPAIEEMIARGRNINVTLIFSLERHTEVAEAYIRGLERLVEAAAIRRRSRSVASFFVSRVDTEADRRLDEAGHPRAQGQARGREREARLPELQGDLLRRALGGARREGRDARSGASGPRPRRRTRSTATCSTSRS